MFLGMSLCLPLAYWQQWKAKKLREAGRISEPLLGEDVVRRTVFACWLPAFGSITMLSRLCSSIAQIANLDDNCFHALQNKAAANNMHSEAREIMLLAIPTAFDLVATVLLHCC
jgi:hypothetical protein